MRVGQNPAKFVDHVTQPQAVTVAVVSYVPFLGGYYAQGLEILKECLGSLWENTAQPYDLMVFDNASCAEVRSFLLAAQARGRIQYLVLSERNVGKAGAWNFIFAAAPGEYIAYADADIYFYPGWLPAQLTVFETIPKVGMVTGAPVRNPEKFSTSTIAWAQENPEARLERGLLMPWEDFWRHVHSLGYGEAEARQIYSQGEDLCLFYKGKKYYIGAGHFQFLARRDVLQEILPLPSRRPMGEVRTLDIAINERRYLRLSLPDGWVRHMGNTLDGPAGATQTAGSRVQVVPGRSQREGPLRRLLFWVHKRTFDLLYRS
jgi:glycosyltransferase involved in cell wall biosynthesis